MQDIKSKNYVISCINKKVINNGQEDEKKMTEIIDVLCKKCGIARFKVIKPKFELDDNNVYWNCTMCIREANRNDDWYNILKQNEKIE